MPCGGQVPPNLVLSSGFQGDSQDAGQRLDRFHRPEQLRGGERLGQLAVLLDPVVEPFLRHFAERDVNLKRLQSRPAKSQSWDYLFYAEVTGHASDRGLVTALEAIKRETGARGLRAILEEIMLDVMYDLPGRDNVKECIVSEEVVARKQDPILVYESEAEWA